MAGRLRENLGEGDIMLGKMVKVLIAFALGFVMGIVGAFAGVGLGGLYAASNVKVGTVTGYILSDKQNEEYLNEKFRSAYLYDAAKMLIKAENLGVVKNYIPGLEKGLDSLLDIELNASNGEKVRVGDLVEIDKAKLYATTYKNIGDAINAVTVTANIETVLKLLGVNLNDLGFGWIENLEIYKGAEYSKYPNEGIGDVAFRQISPQEAASYQGSVYTKSGNTYTLVEKDDGKTQSLRSVVTYYVLNDGFDYKTLPKYYYVDSSETYRNIYEVGDVKLVNNDEYVIEQVTYLPSVTDLAEVWFMEFPALSKIGLLDIPKVIVRRLKNMPINDFAIALENLVPLDMEYNKLLSAIVGTDENGTINDVLNFDYKNIRLNDIADATKLIPEGSVITSLIDLITTKNGKSLGLADTFENLKDLSFNDVIDEFGLGFDLNDYGLDAALGLKIGTIFDGSILNKLKDSYLDKSFDDVIEIVCNITGLKFTLADFGLEDFGKIKFASIVNGTMTDELKTALYDISVQKVIDVLNKNLKLSIDLADYGIKELGSITVGGLINAPVDTLKDALSGKKVGDVVEKILEKLNVNFDPSDYNLDRIFDVTFDGIFDGSIGKDFLDAFGSYSFNEIIAIIFEKLLHIDYSLSDFGVGEFGELKLSDIFDGTISDDVMKTLEKKTFNSLIDPISERFKLNFSLDDFGLYEVGELTFGDIFDGTIIDDALEILDDKTINYFIDKITNKFNVKFDLEDFALEAFGTITIGDIVRGQIGEKALDALYSITFDRVLDVVRKYSGLSIDLDYYKLGALKDINVGGVIKGTQLAEMKQALNESGIAAMLSKVGVNVDELGHVQTLIVGGVLGTVAVVTRLVFPKLFKTLVDNRRDTTIGMIMDGIGLNVDLDKFGVEGLKNITIGEILTDLKKAIGDNLGDLSINKIVEVVTNLIGVEFSLYDYDLGGFGELSLGDVLDGTIGEDALNEVKAYTLDRLVGIVTKITKTDFTLADFALESFGGISIGDIFDGTIGQDALDAFYAITFGRVIEVVNDKAKLNIDLERYKIEDLKDVSLGGAITGDQLDEIHSAMNKCGLGTVLSKFGVNVDELGHIPTLIAGGVFGVVATVTRVVFPKLFKTIADNRESATIGMIAESLGINLDLSKYHLEGINSLTLGGLFTDVKGEFADKLGYFSINDIVDIVTGIIGVDFTLYDYDLGGFGGLSLGDILDGTIGKDALDEAKGYSVDRLIGIVTRIIKVNFTLADFGLEGFGGLSIGDIFDGTIGQDALDALYGISVSRIIDVVNDKTNLNINLNDYKLGKLNELTVGSFVDGSALDIVKDAVRESGFEDVLKMLGMTADDLTWVKIGIIAGVGGAVALTVKLVFPKLFDTLVENGDKNTVRMLMDSVGITFTLADYDFGELETITLADMFGGNIKDVLKDKVGEKTLGSVVDTINDKANTNINLDEYGLKDFGELTFGDIIDGTIGQDAKDILCSKTFGFYLDKILAEFNIKINYADYALDEFLNLTFGDIFDGTIGQDALNIVKSWSFNYILQTVLKNFGKTLTFENETINKLLDLTFGQIISKDVINNLKEATKDMTLDDVVKLATDTAKVNFELKDFGLEDFGKLSLGMIYDGTIGQDAKDAVYAISVEKIITVVNDKAKLNINLEDYKLGKLNGLSVGSFVDGSALGIVKEAVKESGFEDVLKVFGMTADDLTWVTIGIIAGVGGAAAVTVRFVFPKLFDTLVKNGDKNTVRMLMDAVGVKFTLEEYGFGELETITLAEMFGGNIKDVLKGKIGEKTFSTVIDTINEKTKLGIDVEKYGVASFFELTFGDIFDGTIKDDAYAKVKEISFIHVIDTVAGLFGKVIVFNNETVSKLLDLTVGDIIDKSIKDDALSIAGDMTFNEIIAMAATQFNFKFRLSDYDLDGFGELTVGMVVKGKIGKEALNVLKQYSFNRIIRIPLDKIGYEFDWGSDTISAIFDLTVGSIIDKHFVADLKEVAKDITFKEIADLGFRFAGYKFEVTSETVSKLLALTVGDIFDGSIVKDAKAVAEELSIKEALNIVLGFAGKKIETESKLVDDLFTITAGDIINNKVLDRIKEITAETTFNEAIEVIVSAINVKFDLDKIGIYDLGELKISYIFEKNIKDKALEIVKTYSFDRIIDTVAKYFNKAVKIDSTYINELLTLTVGDVMDGTVKEKAKEITANMTFDEVIEFVTKLMGVKFSLADYKLDELGKLTVGMIFVTKDLKQQIGDIVYNWSIEDVINKILGVNGNVLAVENIYLKKIVSIKLEVVIKGDISGAIFDIVGDMSIRDILSVANVELTVLEDYGLGGILDLTVNELKSADVSDKIKAIIDGVKLVDVLGNETVENNELLKSIAYDKDGNPVTIGELSTRINVLTIGELVEGYADGDNFKTIRAIIPADTKITEISSVDFNANILNLTIGDFENFKLPTLVYKAMGFGVQGSDGNWYRTETDAAAGDTANSHLSIKLTEVMDLGNEDFMNLTADDLFGELTKENDGLFYTVTHKDGKALTFNELKGRVNTLTVSEIIDGYETNAEFELIRKIIAPDTVVTAIGTNLTTEKILSSITLKDIGLSGNESIRNILGYTYKGTDGKWYDSSESAAAMAEGTDYENVTVDKISALFDVKNVLNMKAKDVGIEVGTMPAALRKVLGYKLNTDGEWVNNAGNNFNDVTVNELTNITTEGFKNLALSDVLSESDVSGNKILSLLYNDSTVTLANIGEKINELSLKDIIGNVELMDEVEITAAGSYVTDTVLYTLETSSGTNVYTMVDGATLDMDSGKYTYNNLNTTDTYYKISKSSKVWFITFMNMENDPDPAGNVVGAVTKLTEKKLTLNDLKELNDIKLGGTKLKVLLDIGLLSGSLNVSGYDMTMNYLIENI